MNQNIKEEVKTLLKHALGLLDNGSDISAVETLKVAMNKIESDNTMSESKNFGRLYNAFNRALPRLFESKRGRQDIARITKGIKEDKVLREQALLYGAITAPNGNVDPYAYTRDAVNATSYFGRDDVDDATQRLNGWLTDAGIDTENAYISNDEAEACDAMDCVICTNPTLSNLPEYHNALVVMERCVKRNAGKKQRAVKDIDSVRDEGMKTIAEKYDELLTDEEKELVKEYSMDKDNRERMFDRYKRRALNAIDSCDPSDESQKETLAQYRKKIEERTFNESDALVSIAEMEEVAQSLEDDEE